MRTGADRTLLAAIGYFLLVMLGGSLVGWLTFEVINILWLQITVGVIGLLVVCLAAVSLLMWGDVQ